VEDESLAEFVTRLSAKTQYGHLRREDWSRILEVLARAAAEAQLAVHA
jgi:hypothetical protein